MSLLVVMLIISVRRMLVANYRSAKASLDDQNHRYEQMREASLRLESRYREVVDDVGEVVWRCDGRGRFSLLNQAWVHLTGDVHRHALGRSVLASFHPDDHDRIEQAMMTAMATSSNQVVERARLLRVDG
ncbi:MAG: PAS domain-containing protein, partial [Acidimicrobiales bacterium]|nr:PAS domain-containing protein [Acidimicrobiales bacterium]